MELESKEILVTQEGHEKLERELQILKGEKTMEVAEKLKTAMEYGDISENSEYDDAKEEQAQLAAKIMELENTLSKAKIVTEISNRDVQVGNIVTLYDYEFEEEVKYSIVGGAEGNIAEGKLSNESPVGKALIGKRKNQEVEVETPAGIMKYKVLKIEK